MTSCQHLIVICILCITLYGMSIKLALVHLIGNGCFRIEIEPQKLPNMGLCILNMHHELNTPSISNNPENGSFINRENLQNLKIAGLVLLRINGFQQLSYP